MTENSRVGPLDALETAKTDFSPEGARRVSSALARLETEEPASADWLIRLHEALLFLRAHPHNAAIRKTVESFLRRFGRRVRLLLDEDPDNDELEEPEVSGIAGSGISAVLSYGVAKDLVPRHGRDIKIDWDYYDKPQHLGRVLPRLLPLLAEDALVEANVPYRQWLELAAGTDDVLGWLIERLSRLPFPEAAELYDSLELMLRWEFSGSGRTRTTTWLPGQRVFYHRTPLIRRREVDLAAELSGEPLPIERLPKRAGAEIAALMRDTSAVRYRELHGFTFADPSRVRRADAGRGLKIYVTVAPPEHRLPLRAYHGGMFFKNGVPVGYVEGLSLFERMEVGFNLYYTFRQGETAWLYARTLALFRQLLGVEAFSVDPYQIGLRNEEAIDSGAFWFYRKLGFRSVGREQASLCQREERRMGLRAGYRTPPGVLRRLAEAPMIYEIRDTGDWDRFSARNIGFAVQKAMAARHGGDPERMRAAGLARVGGGLGIGEPLPNCATDLALALSLIPDLDEWTVSEKKLATRVLKAKAGADEDRYLRLMQRHPRMRAGLIKLGSG